MEDTRYLTTDFEIMSNFDLSPICAAFGEDAVVLYNGKWGRHYKASFETSNELSNDVNDIISHFYELIIALEDKQKEIYDISFLKIFDIGYESGDSNACFFTEIRETTIKMLYEIDAKIGITIYPHITPPV